jgi:hypothetical protein
MLRIALKLAAPAVVALGLSTAASAAADNEAGVPLTPREAVGLWTVESAGHFICGVELSAQKAGQAGFAARTRPSCQGALPGQVAGWTPTSDGMALTGADGQVVLPFNRWSNSLFVSHRSSGVDIQLTRGARGG